MGWYNPDGNDWYKPNAHVAAGGAPAASNLPTGKRKTRATALIICICVLVGAIIFVAGGFGSTGSGSNGSGTGSDGMPSSWQTYFDRLYSEDTETVSDMSTDIPLAEDRGSLELQNASGAAQLDFSRIYEKCSPSVVGVKAFSDADDSSYYSWGSGIVASSDGYIITNMHVIEDAKKALVILYDGSEYEAELIGCDAATDIAVLKIDAEGLTAAEFASSSSLSVGDSVAAIGNPLSPDLKLTMTRGIVSALNREINYNGTTMNLIQTDASINEGNSGGPLFNSCGQVIGMTNMKMVSSFGSGIEGLGFAIPSDTIESVVNALVADGAVYGRISIGITVGPVSEYVADYYDIPQGLYVSAVTEGSDAEAKGIQRGDIITQVNGKDSFDTSVISEAKEGLKAGDTMTFTVWRNGQSLDITVVLKDPANSNTGN